MIRKSAPHRSELSGLFREYFARKAPAGALSDSFLETALFVEDTLGITLDDNDLTSANLATENALLRLVERKPKEEA